LCGHNRLLQPEQVFRQGYASDIRGNGEC
jgi:hypothetical protein